MTRILLVAGPLRGHVNTMLPLALAALRRGHRVAFATGSDLAPHAERHGLDVWPVGPTHEETGGSRQPSWLDYFARSAQWRAVDLLPRVAGWRPDFVIHEDTELAGAVVVARTGARHVVHGLGRMPSMVVWSAFAPKVEQLGRSCGVPDLAERLRAATYLHVCPPSLHEAGERVWPRALPLRPVAGLPAPGERLPAALDALPFRETIHVTLGTVFHEATDVLATTIAALRELPLNVVASVGVDPARFGAQPPHVHVARYLPHALLLPRCRLVVSHGGAGAMLGALAHGLPQLLLPQGADQFGNAGACVRAGAALSLAAAEVSAAAIVDRARRLLDEPSFADAARTVQAEIAVMPDADAVLDSLNEAGRHVLDAVAE